MCPFVAIAPGSVLSHSPDFAKIAGTGDALRRFLEAAKAMAMTAIDLLSSPEKLDKIKAEFQGRKVNSKVKS
jgi:peptide subunit release factor 1 (eRF1)